MRSLKSALFAAAFAAAAVAAVPAFASTNLVVNGGFENTGFGGTTGYYNVGPAGADNVVPSDFGWTVSNGNVDIVANNGTYGTVNADGGAYVLDLVGYGSTGEISQTLTTTPGAEYKVTFEYSRNGGVNNPTAAVLVGGSTVGSVTGTSSWTTFSDTFKATGASTTFAINETYGANNGGVFLDNVSVSAVPEPASWALMLLGVGGVGGALRLRRRATKVAA